MTNSTLLRLAGFLFVLLAIAGALLPLVPATPFALLAAACFARSSEKWHRWMLRNEVFGPMIRNWEERRCIPFRVKLAAILSMLIMGGFSIFFVIEQSTLKWLGAILMAVGGVVILWLPTCDQKQLNK